MFKLQKVNLSFFPSLFLIFGHLSDIYSHNYLHIWLPHAIFSRNYYNLIQFTKLSWLNTSLWFFQKHNFLEYQISVMLLLNSLRDFFHLCWASPSINLVKLLALVWPFCNSISSKPNKSASPFRRKVLVILRALIKALYLAQWLDLLLITLLLKIFYLVLKKNLIALLPSKTITLLPYYMLLLPLLFRQLFLLCLL